MSLAEHGVCQYKAMDNHQTVKWHSLAKVHAETDHPVWLGHGYNGDVSLIV